MKRRTLTLTRETLAQLGTDELSNVVGAQAGAVTGKECLANTGPIVCFTDRYRTTCLNCE